MPTISAKPNNLARPSNGKVSPPPLQNKARPHASKPKPTKAVTSTAAQGKPGKKARKPNKKSDTLQPAKAKVKPRPSKRPKPAQKVASTAGSERTGSKTGSTRAGNVKKTPSQRAKVYEAKNGACFYCKKEISPHSFTLEHVVPKSHGGRKLANNLEICCGRVNAAIGDLPARYKPWLIEQIQTHFPEVKCWGSNRTILDLIARVRKEAVEFGVLPESIKDLEAPVESRAEDFKIALGSITAHFLDYLGISDSCTTLTRTAFIKLGREHHMHAVTAPMSVKSLHDWLSNNPTVMDTELAYVHAVLLSKLSQVLVHKSSKIETQKLQDLIQKTWVLCRKDRVMLKSKLQANMDNSVQAVDLVIEPETVSSDVLAKPSDWASIHTLDGVLVSDQLWAGLQRLPLLIRHDLVQAPVPDTDAGREKALVDFLLRLEVLTNKERTSALKLLREQRAKVKQEEKAGLSKKKQDMQAAREQQKLDSQDTISVNQARELLGITSEEFTKWRAAHRIPVKGYVNFKKWGQNLQTTTHSATALRRITPEQIESWRTEDLVQQTPIQRSKAAKKIRHVALNKLADTLSDHGISPVRNSNESIASWTALVNLGPFPWFGKDVAWRTSWDIEYPDTHNQTVPLGQVYTELLEAYANLVAEGRGLRLQEILQGIERDLTQFEDAEQLTEAERVSLRNAVLLGLKQTTPQQWVTAAASVRNLTLRDIKRDRARCQAAEDLALAHYPSLFTEARRKPRHIIALVGPTNSGKTYEALQALMKASSGAYLAPLRLLALEGYERLTQAGVPTSLVTGEERIVVPDASHVASTVEMANTSRRVAVAVIDEFQMLYDDSRGWAWTTALCGIPADTIYVCGTSEALPAVRKLAAHLGDTFEEHYFERKGSLTAATQVCQGQDFIREGDAVIAFSRREVLEWRETLKSRFTVATLYGALTPEVRKAEAARFQRGEAQVVVATDAIGMGLNLPIQRVVFTSTTKFDGKQVRALTTGELLQIAGRAGRYGIQENGIATALAKVDLARVTQAIAHGMPGEKHKLLAIAPTLSHIQAIAEILGTQKLFRILSFYAREVEFKHPMFKVADLEDQRSWALIADESGGKLSLSDRNGYSCVPLQADRSEDQGWLRSLMRQHQDAGQVRFVGMDKYSYGADHLERLTTKARHIAAYCWLAGRFDTVYPDMDAAQASRREVSSQIEIYLLTTSQVRRQKPKKQKHHKTRSA